MPCTAVRMRGVCVNRCEVMVPRIGVRGVLVLRLWKFLLGPLHIKTLPSSCLFGRWGWPAGWMALGYVRRVSVRVYVGGPGLFSLGMGGRFSGVCGRTYGVTGEQEKAPCHKIL